MDAVGADNEAALRVGGFLGRGVSGEHTSPSTSGPPSDEGPGAPSTSETGHRWAWVPERVITVYKSVIRDDRAGE